MPPQRLLLIVKQWDVFVVDTAGDDLGLVGFGHNIITAMDPSSIVPVSSLEPCWLRWRLEGRRYFVLPVGRHRRRLSGSTCSTNMLSLVSLLVLAGLRPLPAGAGQVGQDRGQSRWQQLDVQFRSQ